MAGLREFQNMPSQAVPKTTRGIWKTCNQERTGPLKLVFEKLAVETVLVFVFQCKIIEIIVSIL